MVKANTKPQFQSKYTALYAMWGDEYEEIGYWFRRANFSLSLARFNPSFSNIKSTFGDIKQIYQILWRFIFKDMQNDLDERFNKIEKDLIAHKVKYQHFKDLEDIHRKFYKIKQTLGLGIGMEKSVSGMKRIRDYLIPPTSKK